MLGQLNTVDHENVNMCEVKLRVGLATGDTHTHTHTHTHRHTHTLATGDSKITSHIISRIASHIVSHIVSRIVSRIVSFTRFSRPLSFTRSRFSPVLYQVLP